MCNDFFFYKFFDTQKLRFLNSTKTHLCTRKFKKEIKYKNIKNFKTHEF